MATFRILCAMAGAVAATLPVLAGPISKWDSKPPKFRYETTVGIFDVERCVSDLEKSTIPRKIWQPDRPDEMKLIWIGVEIPVADGRLDIVRKGDVTVLTGWGEAGSKEKEIRACAPEVGRP